jgi:uncharacterized protein involved in response to NO
VALIQIQTSGRVAPQPAAAAGSHPLWGRGFRPFFLGVGFYGFAVVALWTAIWRGVLEAPAWLSPTLWHGHEMLFGLVAAAIAGFLLTAAPVWTGRRALCGRPLMALFGLWALGRLAMLGVGHLPAAILAAVDVSFLPLVAAVLVRTLWRTSQRRNYAVVALVGVLALANAAVHAQALGFALGSAPRALRFTADAVVVLIVVIGGRITPGFTTNALTRLGVDARASSRPWLDRLAVVVVALLAGVDLIAPRGIASGLLAAAAGVAVAARMTGWQTLRTWRDPLVWSLHAGMAWVAVGLLLVAAGDLGRSVPATAGLHALTAGAMGSMILAVMTRVGLGHTGRVLVLPRGAVGCYLLVHAGAAARVLAALAPGPDASPLLLLGGLLWAVAFGLFGILYGSILTRPRIDGKEG